MKVPFTDTYKPLSKMSNEEYQKADEAIWDDTKKALGAEIKSSMDRTYDIISGKEPVGGYRHGEAFSKPLSNEEWAKTEEAKRTQPPANWKDTNPKDAVGTKKVPLSTVSAPVLMEIGIGMLEGARKYGRHNYRIAAVRSSVYYDATLRHLLSWWEGEDIDPDSGLSHVTKAITSLVVLRDAMIQNKLVDDRAPSSPEGWLRNLQPLVDAIFERHPTSEKAYTITDRG